MAEGADAEDRTEAATPKRLQQAREQGNVPVSREAAALAPLAGAALVLMGLGATSAFDLARTLRRFLLVSAAPTNAEAFGQVLWLAAKAGLQGAAPLFAATMVLGVAAGWLQTGFLFRLAALQPNIARLDQRSGLKRLFGLESLIEAGKSIGKIALLGAALWPLLAKAAKEASDPTAATAAAAAAAWVVAWTWRRATPL